MGASINGKPEATPGRKATASKSVSRKGKLGATRGRKAKGPR